MPWMNLVELFEFILIRLLLLLLLLTWFLNFERETYRDFLKMVFLRMFDRGFLPWIRAICESMLSVDRSLLYLWVIFVFSAWVWVYRVVWPIIWSTFERCDLCFRLQLAFREFKEWDLPTENIFFGFEETGREPTDPPVEVLLYDLLLQGRVWLNLPDLGLFIVADSFFVKIESLLFIGFMAPEAEISNMSWELSCTYRLSARLVVELFILN